MSVICANADSDSFKLQKTICQFHSIYKKEISLLKEMIELSYQIHKQADKFQKLFLPAFQSFPGFLIPQQSFFFIFLRRNISIPLSGKNKNPFSL